MSSMPREALKTRASKPGAIGVPSSTLSALARTMTSCGSEMSAGVILFTTSAAAYPSIRSAPTLKIWMTPWASVAMLEKLALLKIALCNAPVVSRASLCPTPISGPLGLGVRRSEGPCAVVMTLASSCRHFRASGGLLNQISLSVRPNAERLERMLRDKAAVLANDHDRGNRRSLSRVSIHACLHFNPRKLTDRPLTIAASRAAPRAARFQSGDDSVFVVRGNSFVIVHGNPRLFGD